MKKLLSLFLVCALVLTIVPPPRTFALEANTAVQDSNSWVFTAASHGYSGEKNLIGGDKTNGYYSVFTLADEGTGTDTSVSDPWAFVNQTYSSSYKVYDNYLLWTPSSTNSEAPLFDIEDANFNSLNSLVFEVKTDTSGTFSPAATYVSDPNSAMYEVYFFEKPHDSWSIAPVGSAVIGSSAVRKGIGGYLKANQQYRLGVFDAYGEGNIETVYFPQVTVKADTSYYLVLVTNGRNAAWMANADKKPELFLKSFVLSENLSADEIANKVNADTGKLTYNLKSSATVSTSGTADLTGASWKTDGLKLENTDPYAIEVAKMNHIGGTYGLDANGLYATVYTRYSNSVGNRTILPVRINIPYSGKYDLSLLNDSQNWNYYSYLTKETSNGGVFKVYFGKAPDAYSTSTIASVLAAYTDMGWYDTRIIGENELGTIEITTPGEYYVVLITDPESLTKNPYINGDTTSGVSSSTWQWLFISGIELTPVENTELNAVNEAYNAIVNVDAGNAVDVETTIENAEVKAVAADINGNQLGSGAVIPSTEAEVGSTYTANAPEIDGYDFLYWARDIGANRRIVSHENEYSFKVTSGGTLLTAFYKEKADSNNKAVYYNGNGQLLGSSTGTYTLPALPSMAGYGTATHWELHGSDESFAAGAAGEISGEMRFVAQYGELQNVIVTVTDGTGGGEVVYGSDVTVTAAERNGTDLFNYWENENGEILSFNKSYTFKALRDCTVKAVYKEYIPVAQAIRKIIITNSGSDVFAEFIGIEDIIERGILFGDSASLGSYTAKVTMNTDANLFTVNNDLAGAPAATGYAILANGSVIYSK